MARDFTLSVETGFRRHRKTRKFVRLMGGNELAWAWVIAMWEWAVEAAPSGDLTAIDIEEIEDGIGYGAGDCACYRALVSSGFIDEGPNGTRAIHGWMDPGHTGYAIAKLEAERDRWRRAKGLSRAKDEPPPPATGPNGAGEPSRPKPPERTEPNGTPQETPPGPENVHADSRGIPVPSRFTVHGSQIGVCPPAPARDPSTTAMEPRPNHRVHMVGGKTVAFMDVAKRYPRRDRLNEAASAWQLIASNYPGGENGLRNAILAWFDAGALKRHPYSSDHQHRPYLLSVLEGRRWEDPASDPDPPDASARGSPRAPLPGAAAAQARSEQNRSAAQQFLERHGETT